MSMFNNWLATFDQKSPSPLYGKPLIYLLGAESARAIPGSVVEPPHGRNVPGDDKIAYINLNIPFAGRTLTQQFSHAADMGFKFAELDNPDAYSIGTVQSAVTEAHSYGLGIIAKNPKLVTNGALQFISHPNVFGVIVERGAGTPAEYDALRKQARKDGIIPVWFVFDGIDDDSQQCAYQIQTSGFKGMGVTYSTGRYNDSCTVLLPVV